MNTSAGASGELIGDDEGLGRCEIHFDVEGSRRLRDRAKLSWVVTDQAQRAVGIATGAMPGAAYRPAAATVSSSTSGALKSP